VKSSAVLRKIQQKIGEFGDISEAQRQDCNLIDRYNVCSRVIDAHGTGIGRDANGGGIFIFISSSGVRKTAGERGF
jgi:hypothetical protein